MPGVTHHHPQLLTVKERSDNKVPLVKECPRMIPFTHPAQKIKKVDSNNNNLGESNMIKEKFINNPKLLGE